MTTYFENVAYVQLLDPDKIERNADEFQRLHRVLESVELDVGRAKKNVVWESESRAKYDSRMSEVEQLVDRLRFGFAQAAAILLDYAARVRDARRAVAEGIEVRNRLKDLIASSKLNFVISLGIDPMRVWDHVKSQNVVVLKVAGISSGDVEYGNRLYHQADAAFYDALKIEKAASRHCADSLRSARASLPDFRGGEFANALRWIKSIPEFATAVKHAADHPDVQVPEECPRNYTDGPTSDRLDELWKLRNSLDAEYLVPVVADEREWVKGNKQVFAAAAAESGIPPEFLAAIMYKEDPDFTDLPLVVNGQLYGAWDPDGVSMGENQIQVGNAAEVLGYDRSNITPAQRVVIVHALQDPVMNVLIAAEWLEKIKAESDLADVPTDQLTEKDYRQLAERYQGGEDINNDRSRAYASGVLGHMERAKEDLK